MLFPGQGIEEEEQAENKGRENDISAFGEAELCQNNIGKRKPGCVD